MRTILLVCRSPSGCWHEHRHCQYRYGLRSQYGEYLGFGVGRFLKGCPFLPRATEHAWGPAWPLVPEHRRGQARCLQRGQLVGAGGKGVALLAPTAMELGVAGSSPGAAATAAGLAPAAALQRRCPLRAALPRATAPPAGHAPARHPSAAWPRCRSAGRRAQGPLPRTWPLGRACPRRALLRGGTGSRH